jgi:hypothetical protein
VVVVDHKSLSHLCSFVIISFPSTLPFAIHKSPRVHGIRPWATDSSASLGGGAATCDLRERVEHCAGSSARRLSDCEVRGFRMAHCGDGESGGTEIGHG